MTGERSTTGAAGKVVDVVVTGEWCSPRQALAADPRVVVVVDETMVPVGVLAASELRTVVASGAVTFGELHMSAPPSSGGSRPGSSSYQFRLGWVDVDDGTLTFRAVHTPPVSERRDSARLLRDVWPSDSELAGDPRTAVPIMRCKRYRHRTRVVAFYPGVRCEVVEPEPHPIVG